MRVLGMMSGTSADGIDVALVRISGAPPSLSIKFEGHHHVRFPARCVRRYLRLANGGATSTAEISQLNFLLGEEFAAAAVAACKRWRVPLRRIGLIGSHGQTIFHQGKATRFLGGRRVASTLQIGEPSIIAARTGVTTIADFRPADMAAGGQGAPLVPFVDYLLYRDAKLGRVALNIGGIANVTVIPRAARPEDVFAFDTGPGNMIIDALVERVSTGRRMAYDREARIALRGQVIRPLLEDDAAQRLFAFAAAEDCGARAIWTGVCGRVDCVGSRSGARGRKIWCARLRFLRRFRLRMRSGDLFFRACG